MLILNPHKLKHFHRKLERISNMININIYRYNPEKDKFPYMQTFQFEKPKRDIMVLELLNQLKEKDPSLGYICIY